MSLNDLWNDKELLPFLVAIAIVVLVLNAIVIIFKSTIRRIKQHNFDKRIYALYKKEAAIQFTGELITNEKNELELLVYLKNVSSKDIVAVQLYITAFDVYKRPINIDQPKLLATQPISAGAIKRLHHIVSTPTVHSVSVYIYSIYYADQSEWGYKDASETVILDKALVTRVEKTYPQS